jgi:NADH:ubiquinone oxidoreductase subunit E
LARIVKVATFYSLFSLKPRGKHVVSVCLGTTCFVRGAARLIEEVEKRLGIKPGEMSEDGQFSLETVRCIGCCALAPSIRVDQDVHGKVRPTAVGDILARYMQSEKTKLQNPNSK